MSGPLYRDPEWILRKADPDSALSDAERHDIRTQLAHHHWRHLLGTLPNGHERWAATRALITRLRATHELDYRAHLPDPDPIDLDALPPTPDCEQKP